MPRKPFVTLVCLAALCMSFASTAYAESPRLLGTFGSWAAFMAEAPGGKVCYMVSEPARAEGKYTLRGDIRAFVTHRPAEGARDVFSYQTGYPYKDGAAASVTIDGIVFPLFTDENMAWAEVGSDMDLAQAIAKGVTMVVRGTSSRGTLTTDTFSLKGSAKAYRAISRACPAR
ncbi:MAG TPA: hypothetical protein DDX54_03670 [Rhodospirillaceae bacterium]|nr:hypothetical protein [Alphaproteobacteria bacterium]HBH26482.1 hypothetical protein [Rhodospirillaceae bacterium]